jgi:hypothetical protein
MQSLQRTDNSLALLLQTPILTKKVLNEQTLLTKLIQNLKTTTSFVVYRSVLPSELLSLPTSLRPGFGLQVSCLALVLKFWFGPGANLVVVESFSY